MEHRVKRAQMPAAPGQVKGPYQRLTKHISCRHAANIIEAAKFAREIGRPLNAHYTIMWNGTNGFGDPDGWRLARWREGVSKALARRRIPFTAVWVRETRVQHQGEHAHIVFHLPSAFRKGERLAEIGAILDRLVERHGEGIYGDWAVKLSLHTNGDVRYLLKGGPPEVWKKYRVKKKWRRSQGVIFGKRSGTTQNIGPAARAVYEDTASS